MPQMGYPFSYFLLLEYQYSKTARCCTLFNRSSGLAISAVIRGAADGSLAN